MKTLEDNTILSITKEYLRLAKTNKVNPVYCERNDGTHLPLISQCPDGETVYLVCLSCDWKTTVGLRLADIMAQKVLDSKTLA